MKPVGFLTAQVCTQAIPGFAFVKNSRKRQPDFAAEIERTAHVYKKVREQAWVVRAMAGNSSGSSLVVCHTLPCGMHASGLAALLTPFVSSPGILPAAAPAGVVADHYRRPAPVRPGLLVGIQQAVAGWGCRAALGLIHAAAFLQMMRSMRWMRGPASALAWWEANAACVSAVPLPMLDISQVPMRVS